MTTPWCWPFLRRPSGALLEREVSLQPTRRLSSDAGVQTDEEVTAAGAVATANAADAIPTTGTAANAVWTVESWLDSCSTTAALATILTENSPGRDPPEELMALASSEDELRRVLADSRAVERLASTLWTGLEALRASTGAPPANGATATAGAGRFVQDPRGMMDYGGLETYYGGLESLLGAPDPRPAHALSAEHTARADSLMTFTSPNYNLVTTSAIEYAFVATPEQTPNHGWPIEGVAMPAGATPRVPLPTAELAIRLAPANAQLELLREAPLLKEESYAARLYTGPMYVKYNAVLRGVQHTNAAGQRAPPQQALAELTRGNLYTTTLFLVNSAVVKLGKLTFVTTVYRGVSGRTLPVQFWERNASGVRGGIEPAFMSTSLEKDVAAHYAAGSGRGGCASDASHAFDRLLTPSPAFSRLRPHFHAVARILTDSSSRCVWG